MTRTPREIHALALATAFSMTGCATTPPPLGMLDDAERAISAAHDARADDYSPVELGFAEEKLAAARSALDARDNETARTLAIQAELNAALAEARSRAGARRAAVQRQSEENARLRSELLGEGGQP